MNIFAGYKDLAHSNFDDKALMINFTFHRN